MKYIKHFENKKEWTKEEIAKLDHDWKTNPKLKLIAFLNKYDIKNYTINDDWSVDIDGDVDLYGGRIKEIPIQFNKVSGYFDIANNLLTTLQGCPKWVGNYFSCADNELTNLVGSPKYVGNYYHCSDNKLTSLEGIPDEIYGELNLNRNKLKSLEGLPTEIDGDLYVMFNELKNVETTSIIHGDIYLSENEELSTFDYFYADFGFQDNGHIEFNNTEIYNFLYKNMPTRLFDKVQTKQFIKSWAKYSPIYINGEYDEEKLEKVYIDFRENSGLFKLK